MAGDTSAGRSELSDYDDEVHLRAIRRALASGNAAVMVGSGFSKNAEGGHNVGTWDELANALGRGLTPLTGDSQTPKFNAANAIQLAEQYERLFSRPALELLLRAVVPDERLAPGNLHKSLLSLPWSEVFTTNYDTLLERAAERLDDAKYITVTCREDIPQSKVLGRRRIVKLHGSFASHRPFVVTEEDYRTYPQLFAPFVNMVRQALLENVFCLIGFSGDDPNFLHWIGWVRDMLDKHALPVYLFLSKAPTLGQKRLLQARGVTPLILPSAAGGEDSDYSGRYQRLFDELAKPVEDSPEQWGAIAWPEGTRYLGVDDESVYPKFREALYALASERAKYPGWLVAPEAIRQRLAGSVSSRGKWFYDKHIQASLVEESPAIALAALELCAWVQHVNLDEFDDDVAELALSVLETSSDLSFSKQTADVQAHLAGLCISSQRGITSSWTKLAMSVLEWAQQGHRDIQYARVRKLLIENRKDDRTVVDFLRYHDVLWHLCRGDREEARYRLSKWRVRGSDLYMEVRRAMLVAELGDAVSALSACERAIFLLRQQHRHKPDDPLLLSMESWACYVSRQLAEVHKYMRQHPSLIRTDSSKEEQDDFVWDLEDIRVTTGVSSQAQTQSDHSDSGVNERGQGFDVRLKALGTKGYSSTEVFNEVTSALKEEVPLASESTTSHFGFDLGSTSGRTLRFGTHEARSKHKAAMAWLQLTERVGLVPSIANINFFVDEFLLAAWWTKQFDPVSRGIGILFRCMSEDPLKIPDSFRLRHQRGWLSRFQVAALTLEQVEQLAGTVLKQLEANFQNVRRVQRVRTSLAFYAEVFGRLAIRVVDTEKVYQWCVRLINLHSSHVVQGAPDSWSHLTKAIARCITAVPPSRQRALLILAFQLPVLAEGEHHEHQQRDWVNFIVLMNAIDVSTKALNGGERHSFVEDLLSRMNDASTTQAERGLIIKRLFVAEQMGFIHKSQRSSVGHQLWKNWDGVIWPVLQGFYPIATLKWPEPDGISLEKELKKWLLSARLRPFEFGGHMSIVDKKYGKTWSVPGDRSHLEGIATLLEERALQPSEMVAFVGQIHEWISAEGEQLVSSAQLHLEMLTAVEDKLSLVDFILASILLEVGAEASPERISVMETIVSIRKRAQELGAPLFRLNFLLTAEENSIEGQAEFCSRLSNALFSSEDEGHVQVLSATVWILRRDGQKFAALARRVFNLVIASISSRRLTVLQWTLEVISKLDEGVWTRHGSLENLYIVDAALGTLSGELTYDVARKKGSIPDEAVPIIRSKCAKVAFSIEGLNGMSTPNASKWLVEVENDPLPELRLGGYKADLKLRRSSKH